MAEIIAKFDTVTKTLTVTQDGVPVDNVTDVSMGRRWCSDDEDGPSYGCSLSTEARDKANKLLSITRLCATAAGLAPAFGDEPTAAQRRIAGLFARE